MSHYRQVSASGMRCFACTNPSALGTWLCDRKAVPTLPHTFPLPPSNSRCNGRRLSQHTCLANKPAVNEASTSGSSTSASSTSLLDPQLTAAQLSSWEESDEALAAYSLLISMLALGAIPAFHAQAWSDLPYFVTLASVTIHIGAHRSLTTRQRQQINLKEGLLAPLLASGALVGTYLVVKFFPQLDLQTFLRAYFWLVGVFAVASSSGPVLRRVSGRFGDKTLTVQLPEGLLLDADGLPVLSVDFAPVDCLCVLLCLAIATKAYISGNADFTVNNLLACLIAGDILQLLGLRSFRAASLMLFGLLFYDVFWVFASPHVVGDNVMLTVATSDAVAGPTRILFPRLHSEAVGSEAPDFGFSLLGLGDVAIPGLLASLALRYDFSLRAGKCANGTTSTLATDNSLDKHNKDASVSVANDADRTVAHGVYRDVSQVIPVGKRLYFLAVMGAYVSGLLLAFVANRVTNMGQPALLYIVPCTTAAVALSAVLRSDFPQMWSFTDVASFGMPQSVPEQK